MFSIHIITHATYQSTLCRLVCSHFLAAFIFRVQKVKEIELFATPLE
jgi:hypothetical protein